MVWKNVNTKEVQSYIERQEEHNKVDNFRILEFLICFASVTWYPRL